MKKVAITTTTFGQGSEEPVILLRGGGFQITMNSLGRKLKKEEIGGICKGACGIIAGTEMFDEEVLKGLPGLKVISRCGAGLDNIDTRAAQRLKIKIYNTPDAPALAVAELTVGLAIALLRRIVPMDSAIRSGGWKKITGNLLCGKKVGIVGFGSIGSRVAQLLNGFGCEIRYTDPQKDDGIRGFKRAALDELLAWADIVSVHASFAGQIIGQAEIRTMKKGSYLLNLSRGGAVDHDALYQALKSGYLSGAAIDVFEQEPYTGQLRDLDNVILTPHAGSYAREARIDMELQAVKNLIKGLEEE
ncbi:MAG: phosphoglycerate dehydrogenase [Candidatus Omnitrophica bacterium]|nr:phosphoglycerate dehydrogenase [Candidatus Omnitrophota bacterium]